MTHRIGIYEDESPDSDPTTEDTSGIYDDGDTYGQGRTNTEETP